MEAVLLSLLVRLEQALQTAETQNQQLAAENQTLHQQLAAQVGRPIEEVQS